jgi:hypothetical protein
MSNQLKLIFLGLICIFSSKAFAQHSPQSMIQIGSTPAPQAQETEYRDPQTGSRIWAVPVSVEVVEGKGAPTLKMKEGYEASADEVADTDFASRGPVLSLQFQGPQNLSLGMGWVFGTREVITGTWATVRKGLVVEGKAGFGGGQLAAGYLWESFIVAVPVGFDVKASYLRTWGYTVGPAQPGENYAGLEADLMGMFAKLTFGVYRNVGAEQVPNASPNWLFVWGAGIGF